MLFRTWIESEEDFYWHGSKGKFDQFSYTFLGTGKGYDQEGPGFYFTAKEDEARHYFQQGGQLIKARLHIKNPVPIKGKPNAKHVRWLMQNSPELAESLENWDENPKRAFEEAFKTMMSQGSPHEVFQSVWYDFYRNSSQQYLQNMVKLGYDGVIIDHPNVYKHVIVFSPDKIEIVSKDH
jgi:flavodoxin